MFVTFVPYNNKDTDKILNNYSMIDRIKTLYSKVNKKTKFIEYAAAYFNKSPNSLRNHWFGGFWSIPDQHQEELVELLKKNN